MSTNKAINYEDLRRLARKRLPRMVFDYIDGGADDEVSLDCNTSRFDDYKLIWDVLADVSEIDLSTEIMGSRATLPFVITPTAVSRLFHPRQGERAVARAATRFGMIYSLSSLGSTSIEDIAAICPGPKWFQVYVWKDRALQAEAIERARKAGFEALVLTVDAVVAGNRERDKRNHFTVPPKVNLHTATQALGGLRYMFDIATSRRIGLANFPKLRSSAGIVEMMNEQFDRSITWEYAAWLRKTWPGPMAIKGISHAADAVRAADAGIDAIWISNHGGRQIDTSRPTIDILPEVKQAVGDRCQIILDSGIRRGSHIIKALALGADAVAVGRPYIFGLAAGGERGVVRAVEILKSELERGLALLGCARVRDLEPRYVRMPASGQEAAAARRATSVEADADGTAQTLAR